MKSCCITGHRDIAEKQVISITQQLRDAATRAINDGYTHFISGFAPGADLIFASIIAEFMEANQKITLEAAIPYRSRVKSKDELFSALLKKCNIVGVHSEKYSPNCFFIRNRFMVDSSHRIIAVYDGRGKGGTFYTMNYAHMLEKEIEVISI